MKHLLNTAINTQKALQTHCYFMTTVTKAKVIWPRESILATRNGNGVTPTLLTFRVQLDSLLDIANQSPQSSIRRKHSGKSIASPRQTAYRHPDTFRQFAQARFVPRIHQSLRNPPKLAKPQTKSQ